MSTVKYPTINGTVYAYASIEIKAAGQVIPVAKSINYSRTRSRGMARGNNPDPYAKTRGSNEYKADIELYLNEFNNLVDLLGGAGYGDTTFSILVTYSENGLDTVTDTILGCTLDSTEASNAEGTDALVRKCELNPLKILFKGKDDSANPIKNTTAA